MSRVSANPPAEAERAGQPFLVYTDGEGREQVFSLDPDLRQASVGRDRSLDLVLDWDDLVSRLHARFERAENDWTVVDDGPSTNGTFVNDERVTGRRRLSDGDTVRFGGTTMTFRSPRGEAAAATVDLSTSQSRVLAALCRPYKGGAFATPATDQEIADELFLSPRAVRTHLTVLYAKLGLDELPQDQRRVRLVEQAFEAGLISERDL
jgi:DNA-binding transcriptional ArsR family regulator